MTVGALVQWRGRGQLRGHVQPIGRVVRVGAAVVIVNFGWLPLFEVFRHDIEMVRR